MGSIVGINRELIMQALFAKLATAAVFKTTGRRMRLMPDGATPQAPILQPAMYLQKRNETMRQTRGAPSVHVLEVVAIIFAKVPMGETFGAIDDTIPADSVVNLILDGIERVLLPDPSSGVQTLSGLVDHCWIDGTIHISPGDTDPEGQSVVVVPIRIMVP